VTHNGTGKVRAGDTLAWHDLQLPLYRVLAARHGWADAELAYFTLPKQADGAALLVASWTDAQIEHAVGKAREIARSILAGEFEINDHYPWNRDDFARICQTAAFAALGAEDGG
jgi:hypothetical protein